LPEKDRIKEIGFADIPCQVCMGSGVVSSVGLRLREIRTGLSLTKESLADEALISTETIRNIEISKARPRRSTIEKIHKALRNLGADEEQLQEIK